MMLMSKISRRNQTGVSFIELIMVLGISVLLALAVSATIRQVFSVHSASSTRMIAVKEAENTLHYLNRDIQMTSPFQASLPTSGSFPLTLKWIDYQDNNTEHTIIYEMVSEGQLQRREIVTGLEDSTFVVAKHIDPLSSSFSATGESVTVILTVSVDGWRPAVERERSW